MSNELFIRVPDDNVSGLQPLHLWGWRPGSDFADGAPTGSDTVGAVYEIEVKP